MEPYKYLNKLFNDFRFSSNDKIDWDVISSNYYKEIPLSFL